MTRSVDIRAQFQLLAEERAAMLGRRTIDPARGLPEDVAPASGTGGDVPANRAGPAEGFAVVMYGGNR